MCELGDWLQRLHLGYAVEQGTEFSFHRMYHPVVTYPCPAGPLFYTNQLCAFETALDPNVLINKWDKNNHCED